MGAVPLDHDILVTGCVNLIISKEGIFGQIQTLIIKLVTNFSKPSYCTDLKNAIIHLEQQMPNRARIFRGAKYRD